MQRPTLIRPAGIQALSSNEMGTLLGGDDVRRDFPRDDAWEVFLAEWEAYCSALAGTPESVHWISRSAQVLEALFAGTPSERPFAAANGFAAGGGRRPLRDFDGTVAIFGPSERRDPTLEAIYADEPKKDRYSLDEVLARARGQAARVEEHHREHPAYDTYEACDLVTARRELVSFGITRHMDGGAMVGITLWGWQPARILPPHFAEWVGRLEAGEGDEFL